MVSDRNNTKENKEKKDITKRKEDKSQGIVGVVIDGILDVLNSLF